MAKVVRFVVAAGIFFATATHHEDPHTHDEHGRGARREAASVVGGRKF